MSGEHSRRDFLKYFGGAAGAIGLASLPGKVLKAVPGPSSVANESDNPIVTTSNSLEDLTVREVRDHAIYASHAGLPVVAYMNDDNGGAEGWDVLAYSENLDSNPPSISGNLLGTSEAIPESLAEQFYTMDYRGRNPDNFDKPTGMTHTIEDQIDRYKTDLTITYDVNGSQENVVVNIPNVVAKQIFGWDPDQPIPWDEYLAYDRVNNPAEFEEAMTNMYQVLSAEGLEDAIMKNRNTPLPPLADPNPWYETRQLLMDLGEDPMTMDDLYPTLVVLEMTDYSK